jgi:NADPH:quinone reductase-like Zn-dependent oxidoreductase
MCVYMNICSASGLAEGDVVVPAGAQFGGTWRQTANVDASAVIRIGTGGAVAGKPLEGDDDLVAALSLSAINPVTAKLLVEGSGLNRGDTLLQNAGNGSVGLFVSQVAHRNGIRAVSLIRDGPLMEDASERATRLGLAHLVVPDSVARTHQFAGLLSDLGPVRAAFDGTGEESSVRAMARALAVGGGGNAALTVYGAAAGGRAGVRVPASALIFGGVSVRGFWLAAWARANREEYERLVVQCAEEIARGDLVVNAERRALSAFWVDAWAGVRDPLRTRKQVLMLQH